MAYGLSRRTAIGAAAASAMVGASAGTARAASSGGPDGIAALHQRAKAKAGGVWHSHVAAVDGTGAAAGEAVPGRQ